MKNDSSQRGIALLTILVMVALATILAATIAKRQTNTSENTGYLMRQDQSLLYAKSAEAFFSELLIQDSDNGGNIDHLQENWAKPMPAFPVDDGFVSGRLLDESGKFNLNNLLKADGSVDDSARRWFEKLLQRVGLPAELSQAVIDWQDADDETTGAMGAESNYYQGLDPSYLASNTKFHQVEELKLVRGFEGKNYDLIAPYVTALPEATKINMNTAAPLLLASIDPKIDVKMLEQELKAKQAELTYFNSVEDLWKLNTFSGIEPQNKTDAAAWLDSKSNYFTAQIEVVLSERKRQFTSAMMRKDKQVTVYSRSLAPFNTVVPAP
ncbi:MULTISPECIES: type II secretion system minor pseudopilin GspK [unclassified Acinetobacter]|uniref:type II secretion system minor pseudopilin GspK n=1 Tax=unclassified Acinetobacter TaxID=196816 RepID=UPI00244B2F84|nr:MULTISPECIES: type II secretion system minor pseudopilin GspK [unclassified Acinetobacter]MDH0031980.1 type II secretion system minor pseudopilin GspK [Acinetobacter sp. GD04021]MDH0887389.1 type II secretion system minor pseudopilin GspK [Acinetobacter sp. GD03873]MDH1083984.1 type II secretion system minor pseudopilin GspK [Acinetobacter sp. GD03983]MDH2190705.1 type II secretion system minor pseudopilin GspK [Acinetobacter sp. GD03645]MDH2202195.1 type II secretion system minor pseudopil